MGVTTPARPRGSRERVRAACPTSEEHDRPDRRDPAEDVEGDWLGLLLGDLRGEGEQRGEHGREATAPRGRSATPSPRSGPGSASRAPGEPYGLLGGRVERHERELGDREPDVELDRDAREVRDLERQRALEAGVDEARGGVDDQPEPPEARLALDPRDEVVGDLHVLLRAAERELAGMDDERLVALDHDLLGEVGRRVAQVDGRGAVVVEDAERVAEAQVDGRGLDHRRVPRVDDHAPLLDEAADRAVGEDGGGRAHGAKASDAPSGGRAGGRARVTVRVRGGGSGAGSPCGPRRGGRGSDGRAVRARALSPPSPPSGSAGSGVWCTAHQTIQPSARIGILSPTKR